LLKDLFAPDNVAIYPKYNILISGIIELVGEGIAFSEGDTWKHKRRVISNVFNFDLLKSNIPKICDICDKKITALE